MSARSFILIQTFSTKPDWKNERPWLSEAKTQFGRIFLQTPFRFAIFNHFFPIFVDIQNKSPDKEIKFGKVQEFQQEKNIWFVLFLKEHLTSGVNGWFFHQVWNVFWTIFSKIQSRSDFVGNLSQWKPGFAWLESYTKITIW